MNRTHRINACPIGLLAISCFICLLTAHPQQISSSTRVGKGASSSGSTASQTTESRTVTPGTASSWKAGGKATGMTATFGGSSWTAGKGSFGFTNQVGGVWRAAPASGASSGHSGRVALPANSISAGRSPSGTLTSRPLMLKEGSLRSRAASGSVHHFQPSLVPNSGHMAVGGDSHLGSFGKGQSTVRSPNRIGSLNGSFGARRAGTASAFHSTHARWGQAHKTPRPSKNGQLRW